MDRPGRDRRLDSRSGQAQLELVAAIPVVLLVGLLILQLFAAGYSQSLADGAAEAGAIALSRGTDAEAAVLAALPGWAERRIEVEAVNGRVEVSLRTPALVPPLAHRLEVNSSAYSRPEGDS